MSTKPFRALNSCWVGTENCLSILYRSHRPVSPLPPHCPLPISSITHNPSEKEITLSPHSPIVAGPVPPRWTQASHPSPLRSALWEHPSSLHVPFHSKLLHSHLTRAISRNKVRQAMPPARREATTATSVHSLQRSGAVTLLSVQPETEQAGASGKRRGSGWKQ